MIPWLVPWLGEKGSSRGVKKVDKDSNAQVTMSDVRLLLALHFVGTYT